MFVVPARRRGSSGRSVSGALFTGVMEYCLAIGAERVGGVIETFWLPRWQQFGWTTRPLGTGSAATQAISRRVGRTLWVIATRRGPSGATVTIRGLPTWARIGRRHPSGPAVTAHGGQIRTHLDGWGVVVLRFTQPAS